MSSHPALSLVNATSVFFQFFQSIHAWIPLADFSDIDFRGEHIAFAGPKCKTFLIPNHRTNVSSSQKTNGFMFGRGGLGKSCKWITFLELLSVIKKVNQCHYQTGSVYLQFTICSICFLKSNVHFIQVYAFTFIFATIALT